MVNITNKIVSIIPKHEFNGGRGEKVIHWFGQYVSSPENRLIIGVTALMSQPFIDLYNKDVDEKTRVVSCARTLAKTVVGTAVGFSVRAGFVHLTKNYSALGNVGIKKIRKLFTPSEAKTDMPYAYKQYQNAMGMFLSVAAMLLTNFAIDATLTKFLTNVLVKKFEDAGLEPKKGMKEVSSGKS